MAAGPARLRFRASDPYPVAMSPEGLPPPPPPPQKGAGGRGLPGQGMPRWGLWALLGLTLSVLFLGPLLGGADDPDAVSYADFMSSVRAGEVESVEIDNTDGSIKGTYDDDAGGDDFRTTGPLEGGIPESDLTAMREAGVDVEYTTPSPNWFISLLPYPHQPLNPKISTYRTLIPTTHSSSPLPHRYP